MREVENMKVVHCDICGKEIKKPSEVEIWNKDVFTDMDDNPIEDVCEECFKMIYCCVNILQLPFHAIFNPHSVIAIAVLYFVSLHSTILKSKKCSNISLNSFGFLVMHQAPSVQTKPPCKPPSFALSMIFSFVV